MRKGPTGVGYTLETMLELPENNFALSDLKGAELKAHRNSSKSMISLFTFNSKVWKINPLKAVNTYGSKDANGRMGMYYTMSLKPNSAGLFLHVENDFISVRHIDGVIVAEWNLELLAKRFLSKIPALVFVSAFTEEKADKEHFHYYRAQLMQNTNAETLANQFKAENILVDLRLHAKETSARNHGTGFRAFENKLPFLFNSITEL